MSDATRKLFGFFRSKSSAGYREKEKEREREKEKDRGRKHHHKDHHERDRERKHHDRSRQTSTPKRAQSLPPNNDDGRRTSGAGGFTPQAAASKNKIWPPRGFRPDDQLTLGKAMEYIAAGAPVFHGYKSGIAHAGSEYYHLFAVPTGNDRLDVSREMGMASMRLQGAGPGSEEADKPWETLEQPSQSFSFGVRPGTRTLNAWVAGAGRERGVLEMREMGKEMLRSVDVEAVFARLVMLQEGRWEDGSEELLYKSLYKTLLRDPERHIKPHKAMEKQIADLIVVLSRKEWIDFSRPENQVVAKFFFNGTLVEDGRYKAFFHQLVLSLELEGRIQRRDHSEAAKERLLEQLPECVKWDLALARRWKAGMRVDGFRSAEGSDKINFNLLIKTHQLKRLHHFAHTLKWPGSLPSLRHPTASLENSSSDTMSFFTGVILPGDTLPWLTMNALIDCDPDASTNSALTSLTHMHPNCGFQYKCQTYWSSSCIVGKVLAPTCREVCGWIGPIRPADGLERTQIARIRQRKPRRRLDSIDVESMIERSLPLGPAAKSYPVSDYKLLLPDLDPDEIIDIIRIEKLALKPANNPSDSDRAKPRTFDAAVQFAVDGRSWPLRLSYDVSFINAASCKDGPHPAFFDYEYRVEKVHDVLMIRDWGGANGRSSLGAGGASSKTLGEGGGSSPGAKPKAGMSDDTDRDGDDDEKVLVIEAFGVADNEVLARAWCAHWGLSAIVADVETTCMACAIREAYAGCLNVVILVEGENDSGDDYE